jgi:hypothetical protein
MVALCRAAKAPARTVWGFVLEEADPAGPHVWVEVHDGRAWVGYDPSAGYAGELPPAYLPVRHGASIVRASNGRPEARFAIRRVRPADAGAVPTGAWTDLLCLNRLPLAAQETLAVLLLLPVGALVTALLRNVVGVQTFGTFAPSLLALAFLRADWISGSVVFAVVMVVGLGGRALLSRLRLLMAPKLSIVLTLVVLFTAVAVSALEQYTVGPGGGARPWGVGVGASRAVILPMVILTMLIERFYVSAEQDGRRFALKLLAGTLLVAGICLLVLRWRQLGKLALSFPEGELFVVAALLLIGRYSGYRLSELIRFRDLVRPAAREP